MKRRIALLLVLVLALSFVLASCDKKCEKCTDADINEVCDVCGAAVPYTPTYLGFEGYYNTAYEATDKTALSAAAKVADLKNMAYSKDESMGNLAIFRNYNAKVGEAKLAVYNLDTGAVVKTLNQEKTVGENADKFSRNLSIIECAGNYFIYETYESWSNPYKTSYTYTLYTALGVKIDESGVKYGGGNPDVYPTRVNDDLIICNGVVYSVVDDVATKVVDKKLVNIPNYDYKTDKFYYDVVEDYESYVNIYDASFKLVKKIVGPSDATTTSMFVLSDGNVLIQSIYPVVDGEGDIEFIQDGYNGPVLVKYDLVTSVYNVETGETKAFDVNYMVNSLKNKLDESFVETFVADKIDNLAKIVEIVDKKIDENNAVYASVRTSDLRVIGYLGQEVAEQSDIATLVADNRFTVTDKSGKTYLINEKAEVIGEVSANIMFQNGIFIDATHTKAYDTDLNLKFDANSYAKYNRGREGLFLKEWNVYDEDDIATKKTEYYYLSTDYKFVKLELTTGEYYTYESTGLAFAYEDTVLENEGTENQKAKKYAVVYGLDGTELFKISIDPVETTANEVTTRTTVDFLGIESLNDGSVVIYVETTVVEGNADPVVTVDCYIAK